MDNYELIRPYGYRPYTTDLIHPYEKIIHPIYYPTWEESLDLNNIDYLLPLVAPNEVFRFVNYNGNKLTWYLISTYGRIYSYISNRFLSPHINSNGYLEVNLVIDRCVNKKVRIHRLVKMSFNPIDNMDQFVINHFDGNKLNPLLSNLEWTTYLGNLHHAIETGLIPVGEDHCRSIYTNKDIEFICECLEKEIPYKNIYEMVKPNEPYEKFIALLNSIRNKRIWKHISKNYNISPVENSRRAHDISFIRFLCECLKKKMDRDEICNKLNIFDPYERRKMKQVILGLVKGNTFPEIYAEYNIPTPDWYKTEEELFNFNIEQVHFICSKIKEGIKGSEILDIIGFTIENVGEHRRHCASIAISKIRRKKTYREISDQYF